MRRGDRFCAGAAVVVASLSLGAGSAFAVPIALVTGAAPPPLCDAVVVPKDMHELGVLGPFPIGEGITVTVAPTSLMACPATDIVGGDFLVTMANVSGTAWTDLFFVEAGPATHTNYDDTLINGAKAFRIDSIGLNAPLISESVTSDNIFEIGEVWRFIVQDYMTLGVPLAFSTPGVVGALDFTDSIVAAQPIPEPVSAISLVTGLAGLALARRRARRRRT